AVVEGLLARRDRAHVHAEAVLDLAAQEEAVAGHRRQPEAELAGAPVLEARIVARPRTAVLPVAAIPLGIEGCARVDSEAVREGVRDLRFEKATPIGRLRAGCSEDGVEGRGGEIGRA